jgi:hypothetical protein
MLHVPHLRECLHTILAYQKKGCCSESNGLLLENKQHFGVNHSGDIPWETGRGFIMRFMVFPKK